MVEPRQHECFVAEAFAGNFIVQYAWGEDLQREIAAQPLVARAEYHAHAASADLLDDPVTAQDYTDHSRASPPPGRVFYRSPSREQTHPTGQLVNDAAI